MPEYSVTVAIHTTSNLPEDFSTNTWSIRATDVAALQVAAAEIADFYVRIQGSFSNNVVLTGHEITCYDRADLPPRAPVYETTFDLTGGATSTPLPHEVAICLSFQGQKSSGIPQARNRGRVYLGPVGTVVSDADARVSTVYAQAIADSAALLLTASDAAGAWTWVIWSTVLGSSGIITDGWVDNAFDTQRRRGRDTTSRITWT